MTSTRPYRPARDPDGALEELKVNKGRQFDPECVDAFVRAYESGRINDVLQAFHEDDLASFACPFCSTYVRAPEDAEPGDVFNCLVCRRSLKIEQQDEGYIGVLLTEADLQPASANGADSDTGPPAPTPRPASTPQARS